MSKSKSDAVFAVVKSGRGQRKVRVSDYMPYSEALARYGKLEAFNRNAAPTHPQDAPLGAGGGPVLYLAVRSKADPNWNGAPRATAVKRSKAARKAARKARAL